MEFTKLKTYIYLYMHMYTNERIFYNMYIITFHIHYIVYIYITISRSVGLFSSDLI